MIIRELGQKISSAPLPFRLVWAGLAELNHRLAGAGWLALLSVIGFSTGCAAVWMSSEQIVAWMLSQGIADEASTSSFLDGVNRSARTAGMVGLAMVPLIILRAVFGFYPWSPLLVAAERAGNAVWPVISPILHETYLALLNAIAKAISTAHYVGEWLAAIWLSILMGAVTIVRLAVNSLVFILAGVIMAIIVPLYGAGMVLTPAVQKVWTAVNIRISQLWVWSALQLTRLRQAAVIARHLGKLIAALTNPIFSTLEAAGRLIERALNAATAFLTRIGQDLVSVASRAWLTVASTVQRTWAAVYIRLSQVWKWSALQLPPIRQAIASIAQHIRQTISALINQIVSMVEAASRLIERMLNAVTESLMELGQDVGSVLKRAWLRSAAAAVAVTNLAATIAAAAASPALALIKAIASGVALALGYLTQTAAMAVAIVVVVLGTGLDHMFNLLAKTLAAVFEVVHYAAVTVARPIQISVKAIAEFSALAMRTVRHVVAVQLKLLGTAVGAVALIAVQGLAATFVPIWLGITAAMTHSKKVAVASWGYIQWAASSVRQAMDPSIRLMTGLVLYLGRIIFLGTRELWSMASVSAATVRILGRAAVKSGLRALLVLPIATWFVARTMWNGIDAAPNVGRAAIWKVTNKGGVLKMTDFNLTRQGVISLIATLWILGLVGSLVGWMFWPTAPEPVVQVRHWSTGHLMREGEDIRLLPVMAEEFNNAGYRTKSGTLIEVKPHNVPSELIAEWLIPRVITGSGINLTSESDGYVEPGYGEPTIVTPSSAHWLIKVNHEVGRELVDLGSAQSLVQPVIGIVTYTEMARCLGWPEKELGFADILALRADPLGWARYDCAKPEWGQRPLVAFTDPTTSSTGRSLLLSLYSIAAGIPPEELTTTDVNDPEVAGYVKDFQGLIDHYLIGTTVLNTKIHQGPSYGHFFIMPEDNLIHLYEGTEKALINGIKVRAPKIDLGSMVMIYPKEGSMPRSNCACFVQADWVSQEQIEAGEIWIDFLMEDEQQRNFMSAGFRPGGQISLTDPSSKINAEFGLDPAQPKVTLNPSLIDPAVAAEIDENWQLVKRPGIVTFVVDTSGSMLGAKINKARDGLILALGNMAKNNEVGYVAFNEMVHTSVPVAPLAENRFEIADAVKKMRARGETALYDAIKAGIEMSDNADGPEDAIRAVVVLTDGKANQGTVGLDDLIRMSTRDERRVEVFDGFEQDQWALVAGGGRVEKGSLIGDELAIETRHPIQIFFIGIGDDADLHVGGMLAGATNAEFQGVTEEDLGKVLEEFSKYF